jgi:hypothetical protein
MYFQWLKVVRTTKIAKSDVYHATNINVKELSETSLEMQISRSVNLYQAEMKLNVWDLRFKIQSPAGTGLIATTVGKM